MVAAESVFCKLPVKTVKETLLTDSCGVIRWSWSLMCQFRVFPKDRCGVYSYICLKAWPHKGGMGGLTENLFFCLACSVQGVGSLDLGPD